VGIPNLAAFLIAHRFQCLGRNITIATACATGTQTIGEGAEYIRHGYADIVIAGGTEAAIRDFTLGGFAAMRALPTSFNENPQAASRPFDAKREGFIFSEGAGAIVLESLEHALARSARIYAEVVGHASSSDAYHMAALDPEAQGPVRAMRWALEDAHLSPTDVDYINAHGTSTPLNDSTETYAIKQVFGEHAYRLAISSTKSMLGHAMGASGTLEAIICALVIQEGIIPPTINYEYPDPACDLDYVPNQARRQMVNVALSNSFGLGGQNACLVLKRYEGK
jgi:3-oxoacyl-(acyl-carrier-protein) synthase